MANEVPLYKKFFPLILAAILTVICAWFMPTTLAEVEAKVDDYIWRIIGSEQELEQRIVVIDIDEESVVRYGAWPWPREQMAELASAAREKGVSMLIYDMVFPSAKEGDGRFSKELQRVPSVLAQILAIEANDVTQLGVLKSGWVNQKCEKTYPEAKAVIANNSELTAAVSSAGHITPHIDRDGVVRRMPSVICYEGKSYPALALSSLAEGYGEQPAFEIVEKTGWWDSKQVLRGKGFTSELNIPVDVQGDIQLPWWLSRQSIVAISAKDLLDGTVPKNLLYGKWAIIGSTAFGAGDSVVTPQGAIVDGVEVHVQLISALLDSRIPFVPRIANELQWLLIFMMAILLGFSATVKGHKIVYTPLIVSLLLSIAALSIHAFMLKSEHMLIPWLHGAMFSTMSGLFLSLSGYAASRHEREVLYQNLSSYLPPHAAKWIATQQQVDVLDARHEKVLVLQADLRNFSAWCNHLPAEQAGAILHAFYKLTAEIIQKKGGDVEEYVGDSVTAIWRKEVADDRALQAAKEIILQGEKMLSREIKRDDIPPLAIGIGIEYGDVLTGAFGLSQRRTYKVIGKAVTIAIKLQHLTADIAVPILIGEAAAQHWLEANEESSLESMGEFLLQDMDKAMTIYIPAETVFLS